MYYVVITKARFNPTSNNLLYGLLEFKCLINGSISPSFPYSFHSVSDLVDSDELLVATMHQVETIHERSISTDRANDEVRSSSYDDLFCW